MINLKASEVAEPFGEVAIHHEPDGSLQVVATIRVVPSIEGAATGLALDGSASMKRLYGTGSAFARIPGSTNEVQTVARTMARYLAEFAADGMCHLIYWACGSDGSEVEEIGRVSLEQAIQATIEGPHLKQWGRGTRLLPPVRYFAEQAFRDIPWAIAVFITDGVIEDLPAVKEYSRQFAEQIASGQRAFIKFILIGVGEEVDAGQMEELDDMFDGCSLRDTTGHEIDLWDYQIASETRHLEEVFAEVVSRDTIVAPHGRILGADGSVVKDYPDGLPALLRFRLPPESTSFTLEVPDSRIVQRLVPAEIVIDGG
jgi:hypothetical protein